MNRLSKEMGEIISRAENSARSRHSEFFIPEHIFAEMIKSSKFIENFENLGGDMEILEAEVSEIIEEVDEASKMEFSQELEIVSTIAVMDSMARGRSQVEYSNFMLALFKCPEVDIIDLIESQGVDANELLANIIEEEENGSSTTTSGSSTKEPKWHGLVKDFMKMAAERKEPLVGRESEIEDTIRILCRKEKSNPLHVGEPGVGKTAITLGLAKRILEGKVPAKLKDKKIYALEVGSLMAGTRFRGDLEEKLKTILEGAENEGNVILYIDEIHTVIGAGAGGENPVDVGNLLKQTLLSGKVSFIGATTYEEYRKFIQKDKAFDRRFKLVDVVEPTTSETIEILKGIRPYYEDFHGVSYSDKVISKIVDLSVKYMADRFLPDKAIDIMDEAGATISKDLLIKPATKVKISEETIEEIIAKTCNIPASSIKKSETTKLLNLDKEIEKTVFGQDEAIKATVDAIKMSRAGLTAPNKPIASMLYLGPTGVGKTEVARKLAEKMNCPLVRFDMSEYMDETAVNKFIGSSAGYVGYEDGGQLVEAIRKNPHCVLLLDEIEKAHPKVFNILLQAMDYATLSDNKGRKADFKNVIIIMTSNAGASDSIKTSLGFSSDLVVYDASAMDNAVKGLFTPEFRARLTKVIKFNPLSEEMGKKIVDYQMKELVKMLASKKVKVDYTDEVVKYVEDKGITKDSGARKIQTIIETDIKPLFVDGLIDGSLKRAGIAKIDMIDGVPTLV